MSSSSSIQEFASEARAEFPELVTEVDMIHDFEMVPGKHTTHPTKEFVLVAVYQVIYPSKVSLKTLPE